MKKISQILVPKQVDADYPNGAILNETDTQDGTPVIREIYNDPLVNLYKLLDVTGITANGNEDNETNGYQIIEALRKLTNIQNDIEQVLTLTGSVWSVPFDLSILPNKYVFIARASNSYVGGTYTFKGTGATEYGFTSSGFNASDELLVVIDSSNVRAYSLSKLVESPTFLNTIISTPIRYNSGNQLYYLDSGKLYKNLQVWDLQNLIRVNQSDGTLILQNAFIMQGHVVCVVKNPATVNYEFYAFDLLDLNTVIVLTTDIVQTASIDYLPVFYASDINLQVSNGCNRESDDFKFTSLSFDTFFYTLNESDNLNFDASFVKTENGSILNDKLYTLVSGNFDFFDVNTGIKTTIGDFPVLSGHLFYLNGDLYLNQTNIAHKLNL